NGGVLPAVLHPRAYPHQMLRNVLLAMLAQRRQCGDRADPFGPGGAADESILRSVHYLAASNDRGDRESVAKRFCEHGDVRIDAIMEVSAAAVDAKTGRHLVE